MVQPIWSRLDGPGKREQLAELTGIPANNLSLLNTGKRPMTWAMAERIAAAVPGVTPFDLGAPAETHGEAAVPTVLDRLEELRAMVVAADKERQNLRRRLDALEAGGVPISTRPTGQGGQLE